MNEVRDNCNQRDFATIRPSYSIDHKNIELLRYYISRDMRRIEEKVENDTNNLLGYFIASLVDVLIVSLFLDQLAQMKVFTRILLILGLIVLFLLIYKTVNYARKKYKQIQKIAGRDTDKPQEIIRIVDEFDNIAMDGLLICTYYQEMYNVESDNKLKRFYFCECFHYLNKSCSVYRKIAEETGKYIDTIDSQLISKYRVDNFLDIAEELAQFIDDNRDPVNDKELEVQVFNVKEDIAKWKEAYHK